MSLTYDLLSVVRNIPQQPQRQDSSDEQMRDLVEVANKLGCYDAADIIKNLLNAFSLTQK